MNTDSAPNASNRRGTVRVVESTQSGRTLLNLLRGWFPDKSWSQVRRLVDSRRVLISQQLCLDHARRVAEGEPVMLLDEPAAPPPSRSDIAVRFCDAHVVVVEKPAGMTTLRSPEEKHWSRERRALQPTLDEAVWHSLRRRGKARGRVPRRLYPVHRLDRETSGLMVFALSHQAFQSLTAQFRLHTIQRTYWAVVYGALEEARKIESQLMDDRGDGLRGSTRDDVVNADDGKLAITHVRPLERLGPFTLVECRLETGRTHQIRIHLSELGHRVCGDKVYVREFRRGPQVDTTGLTRHALHACELGFAHPTTGEQLSFKMPFPSDLERFVARLRRDHPASSTPR